MSTDQFITCPDCRGAKQIKSMGFMSYICKKCGGAGIIPNFAAEEETKPQLAAVKTEKPKTQPKAAKEDKSKIDMTFKRPAPITADQTAAKVAALQAQATDNSDDKADE
jgi:hypothetical protein